MSTFDDASLVFIPSGYKTSKAYSVKPIDGSGDLTFTRSNDTATRVNSAGLIEKVRTNLVLQSETFGNASWGKSLVTITDNFDTAPNGTLTADRFVSAGGAFPQIAQARTVVSGTQYTASLYVKSDGTTQIAQVLIIGGNTVSFTPTNTWQRITTTFTAASSSATFVLATNSAVAPASSFVIWGAQLETGDIATAYIPTTSAAVSVGPVANVPRLDYLNSSCPRLLLEPQRTNFARNWNLTAANWDKFIVTATAASGIAPTGYNEAYKITPNSSGTERFFYDDNGSASYTANANYTNTIFAKAAGINWCYARFEIKGNTSSFVYFNLATGAVGSTTGSVSVVKSIENYGNGWYRIRVTGNMGTGIGGANNVLFGICDADGSTYVTASGSNGVLFFGPQSEQGSYPTSVIPTLGAAVTRGADAASKTGISSLIGQTEGTLYAEVDVKLLQQAGRILLDVNDNNTTNRALLALNGSAVEGFVQGSPRVAYTLPSAGVYKFAFAYKSGDFALYVNRVQRSTSTDAITFSGMNQLFLGHTFNINNTQPVDGIKSALLFKTRLSNSDLAALTTL